MLYLWTASRRLDRAVMAEAYGIVRVAVDLEGEKLTFFLDMACEGNPELRAEVELMLADLDEAGDWNGGPLGTDVGRRVGPYRLVKPLGEGKLGQVYLAVEDEPLRPDVVVKLLRRKRTLVRFDSYRHRQPLAGLEDLEHPGIARIFDGGTTDDGQPYLVVEYVEGLQIDQYCAEHEFGIRDRVQLVRRLCDAVVFAHRQSDLPPGHQAVQHPGDQGW